MNENLNVQSWRSFQIKDLFYVIKAKKIISKSDIMNKNKGIYPYITATKKNNGSQGFYDYQTEDKNVITASMFGDFFFQPLNFTINGNCFILNCKIKINQFIGLFFVTLLNREKKRFSYGRVCNQQRIQKTIIKLPIKEKGKPDYEYMEKYIKNRFFKNTSDKINFQLFTKLSKQEINKIPQILNIKNWKLFKLENLFNISGTKTTKFNGCHNKGIYRYITTQTIDNGVSVLCDQHTEKGNVLVIESAVNGFCSYQEKNFIASDHVEKLEPKFNLNKYIALFLTTIINKEQWRYSYGRKFNQQRIQKTIIKLPVNKQNKPDWEFMEEYIKSLPYSENFNK
ncbi:restriction endonuclease subunit S [Candidatus Phytoplasma solani]|uniref:restriction endonuclease subunit S n=1 Tax=Candidatus Phytoplasma solani TaxID=69896 RepID=UPI00358E183F